MITRLLALSLAGILSCAVFLSVDVNDVGITANNYDLIMADNDKREEKRDERGREDERKDKRDCRQDEGRVGKDKRDCKQEEVRDGVKGNQGD